MAYPAVDYFDHVGPWSEQDYLDLPEDRRVELLDGELLVSPSARHPHQRLSSRLWAALDAAAPPAYEVLEAVNVRIGPGRILIPDIAVITTPGADLTYSEAADVAMVVELMSRDSIAADRAIKPRLYAEAGIPNYLRIESGADGPVAVGYRLLAGRYVESVRAEPGATLRLVEPFAVAVDVAALVPR